MSNAIKISFISFLVNAIFSAYHIIFGVKTHSWWLFVLGIYYAILSIVRIVVLNIKKRNEFLTRFTGAMLMLLSLPLWGTVILAVVRDRGIVMHEIFMITVAIFYFAKITLAIINLIKARKNESAKLIALRNISLADACVSIFALQRSMLVSFGDMPKTDIFIFNTVTGSIVCIIVFMIGFNLIITRRIENKRQ